MSLDFTLGELISAIGLLLAAAAFFYNKNAYNKETDIKIATTQAVQEEKNETYTKDIDDNKKAIKEHDKADKEYKLTTNNKLTKIFKITTKLETQNEAIMKKLDI